MIVGDWNMRNLVIVEFIRTEDGPEGIYKLKELKGCVSPFITSLLGLCLFPQPTSSLRNITCTLTSVCVASCALRSASIGSYRHGRR